MRRSFYLMLLIVSSTMSCSSDTARTRMIEEIGPVLQTGTQKDVVVAHLTELGYEFYVRNENLGNLRTADGRCNAFSNGPFSWSCQHPELISASRRMYLVDLLDRKLILYFVFDEEGELAQSSYHEVATFL